MGMKGNKYRAWKMANRRFQEHLPYLEALKRPRQAKKKRELLLEAGGTPLVKCLGECCHNVLYGAVEVDEPTRLYLKRHAAHIREVADPRVGVQRKKQVLVQHGGWLPALLAPIISAVTGLVGGLLNK